eukprot:CAMPEP_0113667862 /NCGR_PEP_ID=MMETSP0038_2-20120614/3680_1 /TAXON_ID=2898 /ORGANISM="Cryptomonas paramecium" /LENGTH=81 /DNA_ID=CAMNT_0000583541 /DNA_START=211 /DNA_END=456 /DNA_ORIENTATION=+ /assembly_acc=CAM_ASM_000170
MTASLTLITLLYEKNKYVHVLDNRAQSLFSASKKAEWVCILGASLWSLIYPSTFDDVQGIKRRQSLHTADCEIVPSQEYLI